jgi:hypothetical protein
MVFMLILFLPQLRAGSAIENRPPFVEIRTFSSDRGEAFSGADVRPDCE